MKNFCSEFGEFFCLECLNMEITNTENRVDDIVYLTFYLRQKQNEVFFLIVIKYPSDFYIRIDKPSIRLCIVSFVYAVMLKEKWKAKTFVN